VSRPIASDPVANATLHNLEGIRAIATGGPIVSELIERMPRLEIICVFGAGYEAVDVAAAHRRSVVVTNTPDVLTDEVADRAVGLLINTVCELPRAEAWLREGRWETDGPYPLTSTLRGRSVGIYGLGRIGSAIATRLIGFALPVAYHNRSPIPHNPYSYVSSLLELARQVDTLIVAVPGGNETHHTIGSEVLSALGPKGALINVGRGSTVDESALITALRTRTILAAGLDVFANEPFVNPQLMKLGNACLLPHVGSGSGDTRAAMADLLVDNLVAWFDRREPLTPIRVLGVD
jgi:lactate dehydrogenase-like 2-hydroxyacid dehydrogenase